MTMASSSQTASHAIAFLNRLHQFRRRLRLLAAFRYSCVAAAAAIVVAEAIVFAARPEIGDAMLLFVAAVGVAIAMAVFVAFLRTPSLHRTATALDRRRRLDERAVSALQFSETEDAVASLLVRDATARLSTLSPVEVFPFEAPPRLRLMIGLVTAASVLLLLGLAATPETRTGDSQETGGSAGPSQGPGRAVRPVKPGPDERNTAQGQAAIGTPRMSDTAGQPVDRSSASDPAASPATSSGSSAPPSAAGDSTARPPSDVAPGAAGAGRGERGGSAAANKVTGRGSVRAAEVAAGAAGGAGRGSGGSVVGVRRGGGGVQGNALGSNAALAATDVPVGAAYAARYRTAWSRAQAALAQDRVPVGRREYVRNYFAVIRPQPDR